MYIYKNYKEWETKQLIKTSQVMYITPVHQLMFSEVKELHVYKKNVYNIHQDVLTLNIAQICILSIILISPVKKWSCLNQEGNTHLKHRLEGKTILNIYDYGHVFWPDATV